MYIAGLVACLVSLLPAAQGQKPPKPLPPLSEDKGHLVYTPDEQGNRIPDFSYCGYQASEVGIPNVPVKMVVPLREGDATLRIQAAIDRVAAMPKGADGFRGVVLLQKGVYNVQGQLKIDSSGVVLRGSGMGAGGTVLLGTGKDRQTLVRITGRDNRSYGSEAKVVNPYVPVNATKLTLAAANFKAGDQIIVHRPSTKNWIAVLHTETFGGGISALGWKPGERDLFWERKITQVEGNTITLDVPLTTALDTTYGGATVALCSWPGRIDHAGVENMQLASTCDTSNPKDEAHRWMAITLENVEDAWVRQIIFRHFAGSAVDVLETARRITVEDCKSLEPVSEIGGQRRYTFLVTGQQTLVQRCYAEGGYHDFAVGYCAAGPNAFVQCQSVQPYNFSGAIDSWASGVLFDIVNVDGNALRFGNRGQDGQGAGWSAANSVFWQCTAARVDCYKPPTANNWAFGTWAQFSGDGYWGESNNAVNPRSLYYAQLGERLKRDVSDRAQVLFVETDASSSPSVAVAAQLTAISVNPAPRLSDWIDAAPARQPIPVNGSGIQTIDAAGIPQPARPSLAPVMCIQNGWVVRGSGVVTGNRQEVPWWSGSVLPTDLPKMKLHITRFVPGRTGTGLTDDLDALTDTMKQRNLVAIEHNYALWYERRRDDHERIRRMDGEVWPPFYELPFARSGQGTGWDGMSKYDLTKYNTWYWGRLHQFADLADRKGLVLVHQNYFQHNIIEAGAHYADFPWRPVNNINNTGFPEPVPYAGDKRLFMAEQFYDVNHPVRRALHRAYIRQCLNNFVGNNGVIQLTGAEFTGPRHFVAFWLDVIREWERETGKKQIIGLSATKDVQDSILDDKDRAALVDLIDIRYWHYQADGKAYAPQGGQNLAPRQHARLLKPKASSFEQVYRAVKEYRLKYPGKAVMYSGDGYDQWGWAAFMAGGSLAVIPKLADAWLTAASGMLPVEAPAGAPGVYMLSGKEGTIVYLAQGATAQLDLSKQSGAYKETWISAGNGKEIKSATGKGGQPIELKNPQQGAALVWVHK
ncbi:MAG: pectate lyase [Williamsia sp.]|nr:pectate lyase [Williamsia sp.]